MSSRAPYVVILPCLLLLAGCPDDDGKPIKQKPIATDMAKDQPVDQTTDDMTSDMVADQSLDQSADLADMAKDMVLDQSPDQSSSDMTDMTPDLVADMDDMTTDMPTTTLLRGVCDPRARYRPLTARDLGAAQSVASGAVVNGTRYTFSFLEGPVWVDSEGVLLWSDFNNNSRLAQDNNGPPTIIFSLKPGGRPQVASMQGLNRTNGLAVDQKDNIIAADHGVRGITQIDLSSSRSTILTDSFNGKKYNTTNDLVVSINGTIFFSDPAYPGPLDGRQRELRYEGVFRRDASGTVTLVDDTLRRPNGVTLSPDEKTLYVADAGAQTVYKVALDADLKPGQRTVFATGVGVDGMAVDCSGNVYFAVPNTGIVVYRPDGTRIGTIGNSDDATNIAFGGTDRLTLYITGRQTLKSVKLPIPGMPY